MSRGRRPGDGESLAVPNSRGCEEINRLINPFLNVDVLYRFTPKAGFRNIKVFSHKKVVPQPHSVIVERCLILLNAKTDNWSYLICSIAEGWVFLDESYYGQRGPLQRVEKFRRYENWPGQGTFLFRGKLMLGPDARMFLATNLLFIGTMILMSYSVLPLLPHPVIYSAITYALFLVAFINFWLSAAVEPGIIPRNSIHNKPEPPAAAALINLNHFPSCASSMNSPDSGRLPEVPAVLQYKMCETCNLFRPPRSKHCAICDNCVLQFDHHCPFLSTCIGKRNYKYFMHFLVSTTLLTVFSIGLCGFACLEKFWDSGKVLSIANLAETLFQLPLVIIVIASLIFALFSISPLLLYHVYLIGVGETTNENVRSVFEKEVNVFNKGWYKNFMDAFFAPTAPSILPDLREEIAASDYMSNIRLEREQAEL